MGLVRIPAGSPRFPGDFSLVGAGAGVDPGEQAYADTVESFLSHCADAEAEDKRRDPDAKSVIAVARGRARVSLVESLSQDGDEVVTGRLTVAVAHQRAAITFGRYRQIVDQLARRLFTIRLQLDSRTQLATDLLIEVKPAQSEEDPQPTEPQRQLFGAIGATVTVLSGVRTRDEGRGSAPWTRWFGGSSSTAALQDPETLAVDANAPTGGTRPGRDGRDPGISTADRLHDEFLRKLEGVARVGLMGNRPAIATVALAHLRDQFTARVAGRIKNSYARSLGCACLVAVALCSLLRVAIGQSWWLFSDPWWSGKQNLLMLFVGAALGTWLSFLVRRVALTFDDLAIVEADLLDPSLRVLFVLGLTTLVGLLFWTSAVQIAVGGLQTASFKASGSISVLIGAFCGLSERALATAIAGRAAGFIGGLAVKGES